MNGVRGVHGFLNRSFSRMGWELYLRKFENGKKYNAKISIEWIEARECEGSAPSLEMDEVQNFSSLDEESKLAGKSEAQKDEIKFLREELSKALAR